MLLVLYEVQVKGHEYDNNIKNAYIINVRILTQLYCGGRSLYG